MFITEAVQKLEISAGIFPFSTEKPKSRLYEVFGSRVLKGNYGNYAKEHQVPKLCVMKYDYHQ